MSINNKRIVALIPARGGSKSIPRKNIIPLNGLPLIAYSIIVAKKSKYIDSVIVSTDDDEILETAKKYGADILIKRPKELATDTASTESVMLHTAEQISWDFDYMILLQPTSPLRYPNQIDDSLEQTIKEKSDSLLSVYINDRFLWNNNGPINYDYMKRPRRQDKEWEFVENGSIYITSKTILKKCKNRLGGKISFFVMPKWMSYEIDNYDDLEIIEFLIKAKKYTVINKEKINTVIIDVDGTLTDGSVIVSEDGKESMKFSRIDGKGIELLKNNGFNVIIMSSEKTPIIEKRAKKLGCEYRIGVKNKLNEYNKIKETMNIKDENICVLGDDIQDIEIMKKAGLSAAPSNAVDEVKKYATIISDKKGGDGFVREICDMIIGDKNERDKNRR